MPRKIEKNAKSKEEALRLAAEEFGVSIEELSYTVEREIGKGIPVSYTHLTLPTTSRV